MALGGSGEPTTLLRMEQLEAKWKRRAKKRGGRQLGRTTTRYARGWMVKPNKRDDSQKEEDRTDYLTTRRLNGGGRGQGEKIQSGLVKGEGVVVGVSGRSK